MSQFVRPQSVKTLYLNRGAHCGASFQASPHKSKPAKPTPPAINIGSLDFANLRPVPKHERDFYYYAAAAVERVQFSGNKVTLAIQHFLHPSSCTLAQWLHSCALS